MKKKYKYVLIIVQIVLTISSMPFCSNELLDLD